jgi:hypothetical protein
MDSNPYQFGILTDNPRQHHRNQEAVPHLHIGKTTRAKLERLRSQDISEVTKRSPLDMQRL